MTLRDVMVQEDSWAKNYSETNGNGDTCTATASKVTRFENGIMVGQEVRREATFTDKEGRVCKDVLVSSDGKERARQRMENRVDAFVGTLASLVLFTGSAALVWKARKKAAEKKAAQKVEE